MVVVKGVRGIRGIRGVRGDWGEVGVIGFFEIVMVWAMTALYRSSKVGYLPLLGTILRLEAIRPICSNRLIGFWASIGFWIRIGLGTEYNFCVSLLELLYVQSTSTVLGKSVCVNLAALSKVLESWKGGKRKGRKNREKITG